jgi:phosphoenolpyruvate carboxylase
MLSPTGQSPEEIAMNVPRCMSTQHPDNVQPPFFADEPVLQGEAEVREAYYAYSHLGCTEQMWDFEGKEVDAFVVKKLLSRYEGFFRERRLGEQLFLTLRVPNPRVETLEAKVLLETLESIPRSFDVARRFYGEDAPVPIFEVILPMTASAAELNRVYHYYKRFVGGKEEQRCFDVTVRDWLGDFRPDTVHVIPLIEERPHLLGIDGIVSDYAQDKELPYLRVFLARSDPALNYGQAGAVLMVKLALQRLSSLEQALGVPIYPILGAGSAPFRGNLRPPRVEAVLAEYPSVQTYTIQSAFKYDYEQPAVRAALETINGTQRASAAEIDEEVCLRLIDKLATRYAECVTALAPLVNCIAPHVPRRRARRLHIGLFGYSRELDGHHEVHLPRAIGFCASLYSIGLPPEILGLGALDPPELKLLREHYRSLDEDMADSLRYLCETNLAALPPIARQEADAVCRVFDHEPDGDHGELAQAILQAVGDGGDALGEPITRAAALRRFLG